MLYLIMWSVSQSLVFRQMRYQIYGIEMAVVFLFHYKKNAQKNLMLQCASVANAVKWFFPCIICLCVCNDNYILECLELDLSDDVMTQDC